MQTFTTHGAQPDRCSCKRSPRTAHSQTGGVANVHHARRTARSLGLPRSSCVAHRIHRPEKSTPEEEGPPAGEAEAYNRGAEETARRREEPEASITRQAKGSGRRRHHSRRSRVESHVSVLWRCKVRCTDPGALGILVLRAAGLSVISCNNNSVAILRVAAVAARGEAETRRGEESRQRAPCAVERRNFSCYAVASLTKLFTLHITKVTMD